jgi:hypothetical protein
MYSAVNLYFDDVVVDVITIRGNQNFHLRIFVKVRVVTSLFYFHSIIEMILGYLL